MGGIKGGLRVEALGMVTHVQNTKSEDNLHVLNMVGFDQNESAPLRGAAGRMVIEE
jgi:hypothetical protein